MTPRIPLSLSKPSAAAVLASLLVLLVTLGYGYLGASTVLPDLGGDNAAYWLTAQAWSPWQTASPIAADFARSSTYPPLYPLLLAWAGGAGSLQAAHAMTALLLLAGFAALWQFAHRAGLDGLAAAGVTFTYACLSTVRLEGLDLHSEPLYVVLSLLALACAVRLRARPEPWLAAGLGVLVAGALLTRSCGVMLLAAVAFTGLRERRREWGVALVPGLLAVVVNALLQHSQHRYFSEFMARYASTDPVQALAESWRTVSVAWAVAIGGQGLSYASAWVLGAFGLVAVAAAGRRAWQGHVDGTYALAYLGLLALWPYPAETVRLFMPYLGLALVQVCVAARELVGSRNAVQWLQLWWLPLCFALGDTLSFASRLAVPISPDLAPYRRSTYWQAPDVSRAMLGVGLLRAVDQALSALPGQVPAGQCVLSTKPSVVAALGARISKAPPPAELDTPAFESAMAATGCRYALLLAIQSPTYHSPFYPAERLRGRLHDVARYPNPANPDQLAVVLAEILPPTP